MLKYFVFQGLKDIEFKITKNVNLEPLVARSYISILCTLNWTDENSMGIRGRWQFRGVSVEDN